MLTAGRAMVYRAKWSGSVARDCEMFKILSLTSQADDEYVTGALEVPE